jgi:hypothetical protein
MLQRTKILLYNPKAVFFGMPLALLSIGSYLEQGKFEAFSENKSLENIKGITYLSVTLGKVIA